MKINRKSLELMSDLDLKINDCRYLNLYDDYISMRSRGEKISYIIAHLAERYQTSESSVKRLVKRMSEEVKI